MDFGKIEANFVTSKYFNQVGETPTSRMLGTRLFQLIGWVIGKTKYAVESHKSFLNRFVNPLQDICVEVNNCDGVPYTIDVSPDASVVYGENEDENNECFCKFSITGTCYQSLFMSKSSQKILMAAELPQFRFPLHLPTLMGIKQKQMIKLVTNIGAIPTGFTIHFRALGDGVKNPFLYDVNTQQMFKVNKTMIAEEQIDVNTAIGEKAIIGVLNGVSSDYFEYLDFDSTWLQLAVGDNIYHYDADENSDKLEVSIEFNTKLLEVQ